MHDASNERDIEVQNSQILGQEEEEKEEDEHRPSQNNDLIFGEEEVEDPDHDGHEAVDFQD